MPLEFVTVSGRKLGTADAVDIAIGHVGAKPKATKAPAVGKKVVTFWAAVGYPPGYIDEAEKDANGACAMWASMSDLARAKRIAEGWRAPQPWNRQQWLAKHKPKKIRARPFQVESAAHECAELAAKAGWELVRVEEVTGTEPTQQPIV